ncbi:fatty-acid amide hydrolase 2-A [Nephila pilipes]|uniref:Fatty-acid amide hydrolase 2-A n=1 Tax=Nephila pilipes TaxID=299642 RepID=A0A8X6PG81_NEPPI|nr:fatty-acid amide hydrolase 2-A [Nephila pilipes]
MCRYAEDLIVSMKVLSSESGVPINFGQKVDFKNLKVYYMKEIRSPLIAPVKSEITFAVESAVSYFTKSYDLEAKEVKMISLYDANRAVINLIMNGVKDLKPTLTAGPFVNVGTVGAVCYEIKSTTSGNKVLKVVHVQHIRPYLKRESTIIEEDDSSEEERKSAEEMQDPGDDLQYVPDVTELSSR